MVDTNPVYNDNQASNLVRLKAMRPASGRTIQEDGTLVNLAEAFTTTVGGKLALRLYFEGGTVQGSLTVTGDLTVNGTLNFGAVTVTSLLADGQIIIDTDNAEAFLVRKDGDLGDVFSVDTLGSTVKIASELLTLNPASMILVGGVPDGASAIGVVIKSGNVLSTLGAMVASFQNGITEVFAVDKDGGIVHRPLGLADVANTTYNSGYQAFLGSAWDTDDTTERETAIVSRIEPTSGATVGANFVWYYSLDGAAPSQILKLGSDGLLTVSSAAFTGSVAFQSGNVSHSDNVQLAFGSGNDSSIDWSTAQATENTLVWALGDTAKSLIFTTVANRNKDHDHAAYTDPTILIHSATDPDTDNTQYLKLWHDTTGARIDSGKGAIEIGDAFVPASSPAFDNFKAALTQELDGIGGMQFRNSSTGTDAEMRFVVTSNTDDYIAFTQPGSNNNGTFFGITKGDGSFIFNTGNSRDFVIGSFNEGDFILGCNNVERARFNKDAGLQMKDRLQGQKGADVASANDITLGSGNYFDITGTTQINTIAATNWQAGSIVTLQFDASVTVKHNTAGAGASLLLAGASDFSATADDTLTLAYDGTTWRELARTAI